MGCSSSSPTTSQQQQQEENHNNYTPTSRTRANFTELNDARSPRSSEGIPESNKVIDKQPDNINEVISLEETRKNTQGSDKKRKFKEKTKRLLEKYAKQKLSHGNVAHLRHVIKNMKMKIKTEEVPDYEDYRQTLAKLQTEKTLYLTRLSEAAGARLRYNNPNIANLSDTNRPTKLAERMSELYDNEWTDAFDVTLSNNKKKPTDKEIAVCLRDILRDCYVTCKKKTAGQRKAILLSLRLGHTLPPGQPTPPGLGLLVLDFQKETTDIVLNSICKEIKQNLPKKKSLKLVIPSDKVYKTAVGRFVDQCISISWHTQLHSPAVIMDFSEDADRSNYRAFTCNGPYFDYLLWPVLRLEEKGPIMTKGIVQYKLKK